MNIVGHALVDNMEKGQSYLVKGLARHSAKTHQVEAV